MMLLSFLIKPRSEHSKGLSLSKQERVSRVSSATNTGKKTPGKRVAILAACSRSVDETDVLLSRKKLAEVVVVNTKLKGSASSVGNKRCRPCSRNFFTLTAQYPRHRIGPYARYSCDPSPRKVKQCHTKTSSSVLRVSITATCASHSERMELAYPRTKWREAAQELKPPRN